MTAPDRYRKKALVGVRMAEQAHGPAERAAMLGIAQLYAKLADQVAHPNLADHGDSQREPNATDEPGDGA